MHIPIRHRPPPSSIRLQKAFKHPAQRPTNRGGGRSSWWNFSALHITHTYPLLLVDPHRQYVCRECWSIRSRQSNGNAKGGGGGILAVSSTDLHIEKYTHSSSSTLLIQPPLLPSSSTLHVHFPRPPFSSLVRRGGIRVLPRCGQRIFERGRIIRTHSFSSTLLVDPFEGAAFERPVASVNGFSTGE